MFRLLVAYLIVVLSSYVANHQQNGYFLLERGNKFPSVAARFVLISYIFKHSSPVHFLPTWGTTSYAELGAKSNCGEIITLMGLVSIKLNKCLVD